MLYVADCGVRDIADIEAITRVQVIPGCCRVETVENGAIQRAVMASTGEGKHASFSVRER